ncbi:zinc finger protein 37 isoform X2 [Dicentrarchus labrax]|uniref:C2H2-type domain-containing protein n=1 Tax=Dicentrarchus labrax TaxID=13489 RepID=A0A8P4G9C3_DICLA|nr:zinc finger protein 37 isoform X2 [Dicentrarchus labrax]
MAAVNELLVSAGDPVDPVDCKPTRAEILRGIVTDKLTAAAREILAVVERTVAGYEEETAGLRLEVDRQRKHLEALLLPRVALCRIEEPACEEEEEEEEEEAGGGELPEEEQQHTNVEDSESWDVSGHVEEDEGENEEEEESAEEPVQSTSLDQEDLRDPEYQTATRGQSVKMKGSRRDPLKLRVCLLQDHTNVLKIGVLKSPVNELKCPRGLREPDFLNLLRSTFPQVTGQFDVFTVDATRKLTPLKLQTLTPEEIQKSIKSTGKGRSALYIRAQRAEKINTEQLPPPESEDEATSDAGNADAVDTNRESAEEPVQSMSLDQENLRDPEYQTATRGQSVKMKGSRRDPLKLRVCLLQDHTNVLKIGVLKSPVNELKCPRGLREPDFLNLLRSTFPQVTGQFDVFTVDATRKLTPLKLQTLTPEEIQRSIKSTGKGRSALYIRAQRAEKSLINTEQLPSPESEDEATSDAGNTDSVNTNRTDRLSNNSRRQQQIETAEDGEQRGLSDDFSTLSPAESDGDNEEDEEEEVEEDGRDDDWKPDRKEEGLSDGEAEVNSSKTARRRRVDHSGVKTKRRKQMQLSLKAATDGGDAPSCKVCGALHRSKTMLIKHALSHVDDSEWRCGVCGEHSESAEELRSHLESHQKTHSCNICGKSFLTVGSLERHATLHTGEKPYKCDICHKAYAHKAGLRNHWWEHVEDKPHKCDVCSQSFAFKQQLRVHSSTHTGEKPYRCDVCGKCVTDFRALSRHKLGHSGENATPVRSVGRDF